MAAACEDGSVRLWEVPTGRGVPPGWFRALAASLVGLYLTESGTVKPGAVYYFESCAESARKAYRHQLKRRREVPDFYSNDYHRLAFDILGLDEIPDPEWMMGAD